MADPFQPRFVDLVRNLTTTQGTGNFTLGSAVAGFTSFATAVLSGESFYYSVIGIDKPAEREVGRGTMQADGTISRDPINGTLTSFTVGNKSIALIAAAEWFTSVAGSMGQAAGLSVERSGFVLLTNVSGTAVANSASTSTVTVNSTTYPWAARSASALSGDFVVEIELTTDNDNSAAIWLDETPVADPTEPAGIFMQYLGLDHERGRTVIFVNKTQGEGVYLFNMDGKLFLRRRGDRLEYLAGEGLETAFVAYSETIATGPLYLNMNSGGSDSTPGPAAVYAVQIYDAVETSALSENIDTLRSSLGQQLTSRPFRFYPELIGRFYLNSLYTPDGDNTWVRFQNTPILQPTYSPYQIRFHNNGNEWKAGVLNSTTNRIQIGIAAGTWSGMEFTGDQLAHVLGDADAFRSDGDGVAVSKRLNLGTYVNAAPAVGDVWFEEDLDEGDSLKVQGSIINLAGAMVSRSVSNIAACRLESTGGTTNFRTAGGVSYLSAQGVAYAGWQELRLRGSSVTFHTNGTLRGTLSDTGLVLTGQIDLGDTGDQRLYSDTGTTYSGFWSAPASGEQGLVFFNDDNTVRIQNNNSYTAVFSPTGLVLTGTVAASNLSGTNTGDQTITLTGDVTGSGAGSFAAMIAAGAVTYAKIQNVSAASRLLGRATAGAGVVEEVSLANGLAISGTALGMGAITPSSVATSGALTSSGTAGNGYSAGAGGAVTQATSKSTAVTLNKICGQVTMHNAALIAGASVSFTLTNSTIAATDVVIVSIGSGASANSYFVIVDAVAAGSCRVQVSNVSAGSLSEALVLNFAMIKAVAA